MSQEQPQKPEAIKYGDVFNVSDQLASQPITPHDASSTLQSAENMVFGCQTPKGGPSGVMQSAADLIKRLGAVVSDQGVTVAKADIGGHSVVTEAIGGQVVRQYGRPSDVKMSEPGSALEADSITIGEAQEETALFAGDKPIDASDAAAIQAAEVCATGLGQVIPSGIAAQAQLSTAADNAGVTRDEEKAKLGDVLASHCRKLKMLDIPQEVIIKDILCRLPVKYLLRFRCVSKSWRSLIDGRYFIKLHLHHSSKTNANRTLLVDSKHSTQLYYTDLDSLERLDIGNTGFDRSSVADFCHGLIMVLPDPGDILLWNPATRKFNKLPTPPTPPPSVSFRCPNVKYSRDRYALGYDSKNDDYKVIRVVQAWACAGIGGPPLASDTVIYSLKANSWRRIENFPYPLRDGKGWGFYSNGAVHTLVKRSCNSSEEVIMAFDVGKEEHREVSMPAGYSGGLLVDLEVMGGFLTAVVYGKMTKELCEVWVMKEYGVKESWVKLLVLEQCSHVCPLAYSKSGDEVLMTCDRKCLEWYNLKNKSVTSALTVDDLRAPAKVILWSLVSPFSPAPAHAPAPAPEEEIAMIFSQLDSS